MTMSKDYFHFVLLQGEILFVIGLLGPVPQLTHVTAIYQPHGSLHRVIGYSTSNATMLPHLTLVFGSLFKKLGSGNTP